MEIPGPLKLVVAVGGIFFSFSYFALLQEDLFKKPYAGERFKSTFFMMVAERGVNALVALFFLMVCRHFAHIPSRCLYLVAAKRKSLESIFSPKTRYVTQDITKRSISFFFGRFLADRA
jgi:UDP-galactose transporter B1